MERKDLETRRRFLKKSSFAGGAIAVSNACSGSVSNNNLDYSIPENGFHGKSENRRNWSGDIRSGKVIFVAHCVLNQNARIVNAADFPAMHDQLLDYIQKAQVDRSSVRNRGDILSEKIRFEMECVIEKKRKDGGEEVTPSESID